MNEYRVGRNFIRVGDTIQVKPTQPGKRNGFKAIVRRIDSDDGVTPKHLTVIDKERNAWRTVVPDRVQRVAQSRVEKRK